VAILLFLACVVTADFYNKLAQFHAAGFNSTRAQAQVIADATGESPTRIYQVLLFIRDQNDIVELMDKTLNHIKNA
jgi:hypothetical protein